MMSLPSTLFMATLTGGAGDDTLTIDGGAVTINGGAGDDVVVASSTSGEFHRVFGGDGDDTLTGDYNAILEGGAGDDLLIYKRQHRTRLGRARDRGRRRR